MKIMDTYQEVHDKFYAQPVVVTASKYYSYTGVVVAVFVKRNGPVHVVVEDDNGQLCIHNPTQLGFVK